MGAYLDPSFVDWTVDIYLTGTNAHWLIGADPDDPDGYLPALVTEAVGVSECSEVDVDPGTGCNCPDCPGHDDGGIYVTVTVAARTAEEAEAGALAVVRECMDRLGMKRTKVECTWKSVPREVVPA